MTELEEQVQICKKTPNGSIPGQHRDALLLSMARTLGGVDAKVSGLDGKVEDLKRDNNQRHTACEDARGEMWQKINSARNKVARTEGLLEGKQISGKKIATWAGIAVSGAVGVAGICLWVFGR